MQTTEIELYPEEQNRIVSTLTALQRKWMGKPDTVENLRAMTSEAEQRLEEQGFKAIVSFDRLGLGGDGNYYRAPEVTVVDRIKVESGHDHERHAWEVQTGLLDGRTGVLGPDGKLKDPSRKLIIPGR